ncbi:MAG: hypothetical protein IKZ86_01345 [Spirochaetaceae bacterium]|nr:hypothetical protein [Spirochaetaceae bacterium]
MKLYILRWNPNISSWTYDRHEYLLKNILDNDFDGMNWSIYDFEDLEEGDYWILQQVGTDNDGIAGFGTFVSETYTSESWRKKDGTNLFYADMYFDCIIDRRKTDFLSAAELEKQFPEIEWHKGHSGVLIEDAAVVEKLILTIVKKVCPIRKPNTLIAYEQEEENQMIENLGDYIRDLCPVFKKRIIDSKKLIYRDFKEGEIVEESFIDFEFDEKLSESLSENVSDEDLIRVINPVA